MSLRNRGFERNLRRIARLKLRQSRNSWTEYKRSRNRWLRVDRLLQPGFNLGILAWVVAVASRSDREYVAFGLAVYGLGSILTRRQQWGVLLDGLNPNYFYLHHPIPDRTVFSEHMRAMIGSTAWSVVIFAAGLFYLFRAPSTWPLIIAWAIAMGVASFGGLVILVRFLPRLPGITSLAVFALYGAVLFGFPLMGDLVQPIQHALMLSPVGSIVFFVSEYELHREFLPLALIPATIAVVLLPRLYGQLSRAYSTASLLESLARAQQSGDESEGEAEAIAESIPTVMAERLIRERWSAEVRPSRPWLDDFIHRNLSARERVVCFLLCGSDLTYWTQWWIRGSKVAMIPVALMFVAGYVPDWLVLIPAVIALMVGIPIFGGTWSGFADVWSSGKLAPFYAAFPVGFREISSLILKVNVIRILAWTPGILLVFVSAGNVVEAGPLKAAWFGVHFLFIAICIQPFMVIGKFSKGSSDSKSWRWPGVLVIASTFVLALVFLGLAAPLFFVGGFIKFAFAAGMVTASGLSLKFYRWGYDHVQWDLLHDAP